MVKNGFHFSALPDGILKTKQNKTLLHPISLLCLAGVSKSTHIPLSYFLPIKKNYRVVQFFKNLTMEKIVPL